MTLFFLLSEPTSDSTIMAAARPTDISTWTRARYAHSSRLRRMKGWRMPAGAVKVDRTTKWGNPFKIGDDTHGLVRFGPKHLERFGREWDYEGRISAAGSSHHMWFSSEDIVETYVRWADRAEVVELFRLTILDPTPGMRMAYPSRKGHFAKVTPDEIRAELAGKDLACWCKPGDPCHASVLLEIANA